MSVSLPTAIKRTRQELADSEARTEELRIRLKALVDAAAEFEAAGDDGHGNDAPDLMPRTDAIIAVMRTSPSMSWGAAELVSPVGSMRGSIETSKDLSAALSYLRQLGKVWSPRRGEWVLAGVQDPLEDALHDPAEGPIVEMDPDEIPF